MVLLCGCVSPAAPVSTGASEHGAAAGVADGAGRSPSLDTMAVRTLRADAGGAIAADVVRAAAGARVLTEAQREALGAVVRDVLVIRFTQPPAAWVAWRAARGYAAPDLSTGETRDEISRVLDALGEPALREREAFEDAWARLADAADFGDNGRHGLRAVPAGTDGWWVGAAWVHAAGDDWPAPDASPRGAPWLPAPVAWVSMRSPWRHPRSGLARVRTGERVLWASVLCAAEWGDGAARPLVMEFAWDDDPGEWLLERWAVAHPGWETAPPPPVRCLPRM